MKTNIIAKTLVLVGVILSIFSITTISAKNKTKIVEIEPLDIVVASAISEEEFLKNKVVYNGMTLGDLSKKLNRSLNSTLSNKGYTFAKYATEYGVDPYLVTAIALHETGCNWTCSSAVRNKNNVGGMMGKGGLLTFSSLDEGIRQFILNIKKNYYNSGLTTPEAMNSKYAASTTWAAQVNSYINKIKAA